MGGGGGHLFGKGGAPVRGKLGGTFATVVLGFNTPSLSAEPARRWDQAVRGMEELRAGPGLAAWTEERAPAPSRLPWGRGCGGRAFLGIERHPSE